MILAESPLPVVHLRYITETAMKIWNRNAALLLDNFGRYHLDNFELEDALAFHKQAEAIGQQKPDEVEFAPAVRMNNPGLTDLRYALLFSDCLRAAPEAAGWVPGPSDT